MSPCQRVMVPGVTISRVAANRSMGGVPASSASHARSGHVSRACTPGTLALRDSELMARHQDLGVLPPQLPVREPDQRHGTRHDQEDQLQAHEP